MSPSRTQSDRRVFWVALLLAGAAWLLPAPDAGALELPVDMAEIDANGDAVADFEEFARFAAAQGVRPTEAAQHFTQISGDDAVLNAAELFLAARVHESASWTTGYEIDVFWDADPDGRILEITPNEEVAGEVIHAFEDYRRVEAPDPL
ncbi:MAG: hypothetical protein WBG08_00950 [Litorimonas sp.]